MVTEKTENAVLNQMIGARMRTQKMLVGAAILLALCNPAYPCTVFFASDGKLALAGNNEDHANPEGKIWFQPAEKRKYGRVYFGVDDWIRQGGMNDQGLFFDTVWAPKLEMPELKDKGEYPGDLITQAMEECGTVKEVIALFKRLGPFYDPTPIPSVTGAMIFADKSGDSVIIEGGVHIRKKGRYQVMANFYQSRPELGNTLPGRDTIAKQVLEASPQISVDLFRRILAATHLDHEVGFSRPTVYSNIYDLKKGLVYVYHFHNFENAVVIDLADELKKGEHSYDLTSLFGPTYAFDIYRKGYRQSLKSEGP